MAAVLNGRKRAKPAEVNRVLLALCTGRFLTLPDLARLTGRTYDTIRVHYVPRLVESGSLEQRYPDQPTHRGRAYRTVAGKGDGGS